MTVFTARDLEMLGITRVDQLFRGDVPGLFTQAPNARNILEKVSMYSRGATTLSPTGGYTNPIKTYVDGVELADPAYLSQIDLHAVDRIEILPGPQASTIYGSNAINGVMQIFTKRGTHVGLRPQLSATLMSGLIENRTRSSMAPQHDYAAQIRGTEARLSYNAGASWYYVGPWTPAKRMARLSGFGGATVQQGGLTTDVRIRLSTTKNNQSGHTSQGLSSQREIGKYPPSSSTGLVAPTTQHLVTSTLGLTVAYAPRPWWTQELLVGRDQSDTDAITTARGYQSPSDTTHSLTQTNNGRTSLRYATTARIPVSPMLHAVVTLGADSWRNLLTSTTVRPQSLTGTLSGTPTVTREPGHNAGGFLQAQMGVQDRLFLTYGLRAEWNSNFGDAVEPNLAPRYGLAYVHDIGLTTVKLRASYGRSTRPPAERQKTMQLADASLIPTYGVFESFLANPELGPEFQQGGEIGLELYAGQRGSLVMTRYNQTVDGLIASPSVDSARSLLPNSPSQSHSVDEYGYGYYRQYQNLNVGSLRNQGWELQGTTTVGPLTARGTYSWTKSRVIGITERYRSVLVGTQYQQGASFQYLPEHTWMLGVTYARARTMATITWNGIGMLRGENNELYYNSLFPLLRLPSDRLRFVVSNYAHLNAGYVTANFNGSHRFSPRIEGVVQVLNLVNTFQDDISSLYATIGRQSKLGVRVTL